LVRSRYVTEFEQLGSHEVRLRVQRAIWDQDKHRNAQAWLKEQDELLAKEVGRQQMSIAQDAIRVASEAAQRAATASQSQARMARAALLIAIVALAVSILTPEKITAYALVLVSTLWH
jgi:hypothetical protein